MTPPVNGYLADKEVAPDKKSGLSASPPPPTQNSRRPPPLPPSVGMPPLTTTVLLAALASSCVAVIVRHPTLGEMEGTTNLSLWTGRTIYQFKGIPFALPPSGARRFKPPEPAEPWDGVLNATEFKRMCPQSSLLELNKLKDLHKTEDVEDCLHLNVYTNQVPGKCSELSPVMFYLHGGSFRLGSGREFSPNYLLERDVLLVVTQYRLGPLGFLSFQNEDVSGNMGLLDMVLALKWVQEHISGFCGDPRNVTIFGQSSGGAAVSLLMASPLTQDKKLFQRAIVQSGSAICDWAIELNPTTTARGVASSANCTGSDLDMAICLRNLSAYDVLTAHLKYVRNVLVEERMAVNGRMGGNHAVIQSSGSPKFLTENPKVSFESGRFLDIPTMVGMTKHEGTFFLGSIIDTTGVLTDVFTDKFFTKDQLGNFTAMTPGLVDLCGITVLKSCIIQVARKQFARAPTYLYSFSYLGHLTKFGYGEEVHYPFPGGVAHSDDLIYLFPVDSGNLTETERHVADTMVKLWTNFAARGDPNPIQEVRWEPMESNFGPYLRLDTHTTLREDISLELNITMQEGLGKVPPILVPTSSASLTLPTVGESDLEEMYMLRKQNPRKQDALF